MHASMSGKLGTRVCTQRFSALLLAPIGIVCIFVASVEHGRLRAENDTLRQKLEAMNRE